MDKKHQFQQLLDRANKRFAKLRALERTDFSWATAQVAFHKTFDCFSKLWQFQLLNRPALLDAGLQRSELGSIASKIGQLYYNFYLRSGDTGALSESYTFYDAVHTRQYFASTADAPDPAAATRQLRFYARFVVVCLLMQRKEEALQLLQELQAAVSSYELQFSAPDAQDWQLVVNEVTALMAAADAAMPPPRSPGSPHAPFRPPLRCRLDGPAASCGSHRPRMREALLVSYRPRQVKVAELPLELYRMAQALEWQDARLAAGQEQQQQEQPASGRSTTNHDDGSSAPAGSSPPGPLPGTPGSAAGASGRGLAAASSSSGGAGDGAAAAAPLPRSLPRHLMHRPTVQQLLCALLSVTSSIPHGSDDFALLYLSADSAGAAGGEGTPQRGMLLCPQAHAHQQQQQGPGPGAGAVAPGCSGAVAVTSCSNGAGQDRRAAAPPPCSQPYQDGLLLPGELLVAARRRRLLLVVDSDMAGDFAALQATAPGCPLLCLLSPDGPCDAVPCSSHPSAAAARYGTLTSMALSCPAQALCVMAGVCDAEPQLLQKLKDVIDGVLLEVGREMRQQLLASGTGATCAAPAGGDAPSASSACPASSSSSGASPLSPPYGAWAPVFEDTLSRRLLLHFAFFRCCMALRAAAKGCDAGPASPQLPRALPPLPPAVDAAGHVLCAGVRRAAAVLGREAMFMAPGGVHSPAAGAAGIHSLAAVPAAAAVAAVASACGVDRAAGAVVTGQEAQVDGAAAVEGQLAGLSVQE